MKNRNAINNHPQSRKGVSNRVITQQNQVNEKKIQSSNNSVKEKDQNLKGLVRQYLQKNGYIRTSQIFKTQKPVKRTNTVMGNHRSTNDQQKSILQMFDKGQRDQFFKHTTKIFTNPEQNLKKLQFQLNVYFCIYTIHPSIKKGSHMDRNSAQAFKKYIDAKGSQVTQYPQLLIFFALPHIPKPQQHPGMAHVFTKEWVNKLKGKIQQILKQNLKQQNLNFQKKNRPMLEELFENYGNERQFSHKQQQFECKENCKHILQLNQSKIQNKQLLNYVDIIQQNLKDLNQVSKSNLIESNKKWFQFSKQILQLAKKAVKGQKVDKLQRYEKFFGNNIDQLIYNSADISIFEKNSYFTEDISLVPQHKNCYIDQKKVQEKKQPQLCQIDMQKIMLLFLKADKPEYQKQICLVLKALKDRFYKLKNVIQRRQIIVTYQRTDICAIKPQNYHIQKKLLLNSSQKVKQFYLRLLNHITTDNLGNQYLSSSQKLIQNLIGILGTTTQQIVYRKHAFGILQRFSYIRQSQVMMISFGVIPIIFRIFRSQAEQLTFSSIQYLMGLIMNLAIKKESIVNFQKHKGQILPLLLKYIDVDDAQIRGYVNGTLYVLLQMSSFRNQAIKHKLYHIVQGLLQKYSLKLSQAEQQDLDVDPDDYGIVIRQYKYILQRLQEQPQSQSQIYQCSDQDQDQQEDDDDELDDISNMSYGSSSSEYIDGFQGVLNGQQLLMKKFALLGPEAVRQQLLTRSILDQTGRKSNNMTTSINHSKRIDKVFHKNERPQTPSLLPNLDLSAPQMFK